MNKINPFAMLLLITVFASCGNEDGSEKVIVKKTGQKNELQSQIVRLEGEMHRSLEINNVTAGLAIKAYDDYAKLYPDDSITPDHLFKAAEIATAIEQYPQALRYYETIADKYPGYKLVQETLFLQASLLDHYLNDDIKAEDAYEKLIEKYPSGIYTTDAKAAINNLGKTDAELHQEFRKKNGEK